MPAATRAGGSAKRRLHAALPNRLEALPTVGVERGGVALAEVDTAERAAVAGVVGTPASVALGRAVVPGVPSHGSLGGHQPPTIGAAVGITPRVDAPVELVQLLHAGGDPLELATEVGAVTGARQGHSGVLLSSMMIESYWAGTEPAGSSCKGAQ